MNTSSKQINFDVEKAIDYAFNGKFVISFYDYLKSVDAKKVDVESFIESATYLNINIIISDLNEYLEGGSDSEHKQLREAYGHIPKPEARKIKNYLANILDDARRYKSDKRPGRRPKGSK